MLAIGEGKPPRVIRIVDAETFNETVSQGFFNGSEIGLKMEIVSKDRKGDKKIGMYTVQSYRGEPGKQRPNIVQCATCAKKLGPCTFGTLTSHVMACTSGEDDTTCPVCYKKFSRRDHLKRHYLRFHANYNFDGSSENKSNSDGESTKSGKSEKGIKKKQTKVGRETKPTKRKLSHDANQYATSRQPPLKKEYITTSDPPGLSYSHGHGHGHDNDSVYRTGSHSDITYGVHSTSSNDDDTRQVNHNFNHTHFHDKNDENACCKIGSDGPMVPIQIRKANARRMYNKHMEECDTENCKVEHVVKHDDHYGLLLTCNQLLCETEQPCYIDARCFPTPDGIGDGMASTTRDGTKCGGVDETKDELIGYSASDLGLIRHGDHYDYLDKNGHLIHSCDNQDHGKLELMDDDMTELYNFLQSL